MITSQEALTLWLKQLMAGLCDNPAIWVEDFYDRPDREQEVLLAARDVLYERFSSEIHDAKAPASERVEAFQ